MTVLRGERVVLRPLTAADVAPLAAIFATPEVADELAGLAQAWEEADPMYRHGGIDLSLHPRFHGRGLGADTVRTVARWLLEERGHHRVTIDPAADNAAAIRCYERVGFRRVGVMRRYERGADGTWHDGLLMDLLTGELR